MHILTRTNHNTSSPASNQSPFSDSGQVTIAYSKSATPVQQTEDWRLRAVSLQHWGTNKAHLLQFCTTHEANLGGPERHGPKLYSDLEDLQPMSTFIEESGESLWLSRRKTIVLFCLFTRLLLDLGL
ncbi:hypothetical protein ElyMa_003902500 [Elysia marginata]|uniref:Uncharacterized protein n=1 Tax=Elysia marginata TaxID=1093978 RepID=A0AAV4FP59_9GAST|nr:hypothetical protein ElyMa_003902500 [Elysia marginata]